jgi:hypothetical protein
MENLMLVSTLTDNSLSDAADSMPTDSICAATHMFLGQPIVNVSALLMLLTHFALNMLVVTLIVQCFYYPKSKRRDYYFTYELISVCIFMLIFLMGGVKMKVGVALGLFAIFGIIRYRTESVPIREMTYLFLVIALSALNGLSLSLSWAEIVGANLLVIIAVWICESRRLVTHYSCKFVKYDNIDLILPEKRDEMIADLQKRIGLKIYRVEVGSIDLLKDCALIKVYYEDNAIMENTAESLTNLPKMYD